ncbi:MBL fold metallo-hydrolase [Virgibacillus natechei]
MFFRAFFDENLAQMSYLVGCERTGEAIVIDPARCIDPYLKIAKKKGFKIIATAETHIHADFLSGSRELAKNSNATVYVSDEGGESWKYHQVEGVNYMLLKDNITFKIGLVEFQVMHTPGHTPESISFILRDTGTASSQPMGVFTGDFIFVGEIGRPDLLEKSAGLAGSAESGARQMFQSLQRFKELPDFMQVWPAHGAGSACGKSLGAVPMSTVGYEKLSNWALKEDNKENFVKTLLTGQPTPPNYFAMMKKLNKIGPPLVNEAEIEKLESPDELMKYGSNTVLLDTRRPGEFANAHLAGAINIPFNQSFTNWAGELISYDQDIVLIVAQEYAKKIKESLSSIGLDRVVSSIEPALTLLDQERIESYEEVDVQKLRDLLDDEHYHLIDVRNQSEWDEGRIEGADLKTLSSLLDLLDDLPEGKTYLVQCHSGARSAIAASLMQANGYKDVKNVKGGYLAWMKEKFPVKS